MKMHSRSGEEQEPALRYKCSQCSKSYSRTSHLRRHEATHNDSNRIQCPSCSKEFVRMDVARRHIARCMGDDEAHTILPTAKRGKKSKSCDRCSQTKVSCDLGTPCARCLSCKLPCSYSRAETDATVTQRSVMTVTEEEIPWLLKMTDHSHVKEGDAKGRDIYADEDAYDAFWTLTAPQPLETVQPVQPSSLAPTQDEDPFSFGIAAWIAEESPLSWSEFDQHMELDDTSSQSSVLESRIQQLISGLAGTYNEMKMEGRTGDIVFDYILAESTFTTGNLQYFVWLYFQRVHPYHPILHPATFNCETTSLPLLLAVFLFGALFSAPYDSAVSARSLFDLAEEYIFTHPDMKRVLASPCDRPPTTATEEIEILQAGVTIIMIQNSRNDQITRRRIRVERYPPLSAAVRLSGVFHSRHAREISEYSAATWDDFVQDELRVRLAHWTQLVNNFSIGCFNAHTQSYMCEMTGDMPCRRELFESVTSDAFEYQVSMEPIGPRPQTLASSVAILLQDSWPGIDDDMYRRMTPETLSILMSAIGNVIVIARTNCLFSLSCRALLRACMRWKSLWDAATKSEFSGEKKSLGFSKHAMELWWLSVAVIKAQQSGDKSHYMWTMGLDSFNSVNEFLTRYITTLASHDGAA